MKRNPHPARRTRIATLGISAGAFVSVVSGLVWNTQQAELVANVADANTVVVEQTASIPNTTKSAVPDAVATTPAATIAPTSPAAPTKKSSATGKTKKSSSTTPTNAVVAPATPAAPLTPAVAPATPVAAPVVYTCMSPGGKTESPTGSGSCKNAKYGYVLTQI
jgi:hypothetical protein